MKSRDEVIDLLTLGTRDVERTIGVSMRNGQAIEAVRLTLRWVLK